MHSAKLLLALGASLVTAKSCPKDVEITELNQVIDCDTAEKDVIISKNLEGNDVQINNLKKIKGSLIIKDNKAIASIRSDSLTEVEGTLQIQGLENLRQLNFGSLETIGNLKLISLPYLNQIAFGTDGVTGANEIEISNTFLSDLSGLKLATVDKLSINNNAQLKTFTSELVNITDAFVIESNGKAMEITMKKLQSAGEIQLANIKSFSVPSLKSAGSIKLNKNPELETFNATKVTSIKNSVTFIDNKKLQEVNFPELKEIGDMTIQNNTAMTSIAGFPKLEDVTGAIQLRGDFEKVELPKLRGVEGTAIVTSSTDIKDFCEFFDEKKEDKVIKGDTTCSWNNPDANKEGGEDNGETSSGSGGSGGKGSGGKSDSSSDDDEGAAGSLGASTAMLGMALLAGFALLL
jgi:hypothetical protein